MKLSIFRSLTFRQKMQYLWDYDKYYFLAGILFICFFCYFIVPYLSSLKQDTRFSIAIIDCSFDRQSDSETLEQMLLSALGLTEKQDHIRIDTSASSQETDSVSVINTTIAMSGISENDIVICDEATYLKFQEQGAFLTLSDFMEDHTLSGISATGDAVDLSQSERWQNLGYTTYTPAYACVLKEAVHPDYFVSFIAYFFP